MLLNTKIDFWQLQYTSTEWCAVNSNTSQQNQDGVLKSDNTFLTFGTWEYIYETELTHPPLTALLKTSSLQRQLLFCPHRNIYPCV